MYHAYSPEIMEGPTMIEPQKTIIKIINGEVKTASLREEQLLVLLKQAWTASESIGTFEEYNKALEELGEYGPITLKNDGYVMIMVKSETNEDNHIWGTGTETSDTVDFLGSMTECVKAILCNLAAVTGIDESFELLEYIKKRNIEIFRNQQKINGMYETPDEYKSRLHSYLWKEVKEQKPDNGYKKIRDDLLKYRIFSEYGLRKGTNALTINKATGLVTICMRPNIKPDEAGADDYRALQMQKAKIIQYICEKNGYKIEHERINYEDIIIEYAIKAKTEN